MLSFTHVIRDMLIVMWLLLQCNGVLHFMLSSCNFQSFWELESRIISGFEMKFWIKSQVQLPIYISLDTFSSNRQLQLLEIFLKFLFSLLVL